MHLSVKVSIIVWLSLCLCPALGQTYNVPSSGNQSGTVTPGITCTIYDPGGENDYPNHCNGKLTLTSTSGASITLTGSYDTENCCDFLKIYDGSVSPTNLIGTFKGNGMLNVTVPSGTAVLHFTSDGTMHKSGFHLNAQTICAENPQWVQNVSHTATDSSITISWADPTNTTSWTVIYGHNMQATSVQHCSNPHITIGSLSSDTRYYYRIINDASDSTSYCGSMLYSVQTLCPTSSDTCIDYTNLTSCRVTAHYGTFTNPDMMSGIVDYGSSSPASRHTIHNDPSETDPRTDNQLHTVPDGYNASVRLGNWQTGANAESITYEYLVDTLRSDLLIMKYAAVLQNPNHNDSEQPRFKFQILDSDNHEINSGCYSAEFIANTSLGWNCNHDSTILWKDWTTVGIDLAGLHGQTIHIKLTTFDCNQGQHFGYAYFTFDCGTKSLTYESCSSSTENTFTAPEGFNYRWYSDDNPDSTLSEQQSLHVTQAGEYHCTISFIGGTSSGTSCSFTLTGVAVEHPESHLSIDTAVVQNALPFTVGGTSFNQSVTDHDIVLSGANSQGCDSIIHLNLQVWNNISSSVDTTLCENSLPLIWNGINFNGSGTHNVLLAGSHGEDSTVTMTVNVLQNSSMTRHDTVVENSLPVSIGGITFFDIQQDTTWTITNAAGCDSIIHYSLHVWHNTSTAADTTLCQNSMPFLWNSISFNDSGYESALLVGMHGEDSTVTMTVNVLRNSSMTLHDTVVENSLPTTVGGITFYHPVADTTIIIENTVGCDSIILYSLHVWYNYHHHFYRTVCDNMLPLEWCGETFSKRNTSIIQHLTSIHGTDSIVELTLTVRPSYNVADTVEICNGQSTIYGQTESGDYLIPLTTTPIDGSATSGGSEPGCDSIVNLNVIVHPVFYSRFHDTICSNQQTIFEGIHLSETGHYEQHYSTQYGCDSLRALDLVVHNTDHTFSHATVCDGLPYTWENNITYYHTTYEPTILYTNQAGCDSVVQLILDLAENYESRMKITPELVDYTNNEVRLHDISESQRRIWYFADREDTNRVVTFTYPSGLDSLNVLLVSWSRIGCLDSVWGTVHADRAAIWAPNAFTPDAETNNLFTITANEISQGHVWIYNRQGNIICHFDLLTGSWDGRYKGQPCPQEAYIWKLNYKTLAKPNTEQQTKGTVLLLR